MRCEPVQGLTVITLAGFGLYHPHVQGVRDPERRHRDRVVRWSRARLGEHVGEGRAQMPRRLRTLAFGAPLGAVITVVNEAGLSCSRAHRVSSASSS